MHICALPQRVNCVKMNDEATLILSGEHVIVLYSHIMYSMYICTPTQCVNDYMYSYTVC